jgi:hypothetical protein
MAPKDTEVDCIEPGKRLPARHGGLQGTAEREGGAVVGKRLDYALRLTFARP